MYEQIFFPFKLCSMILVFLYMCFFLSGALSTERRTMKGKFHAREKRDVELIVECDTECLPEDELPDTDVFIEYVDNNKAYSDYPGKSCAHSCQIVGYDPTTTASPKNSVILMVQEDSLKNKAKADKLNSTNQTKLLTPKEALNKTLPPFLYNMPPANSLNQNLTYMTDVNMSDILNRAMYRKFSSEETNRNSIKTATPFIDENSRHISPTKQTLYDLSEKIESRNLPTVNLRSNGSSAVQLPVVPPIPTTRTEMRLNESTIKESQIRVIPKVIRLTMLEAEMVEAGALEKPPVSQANQEYYGGINPKVLNEFINGVGELKLAIAAIKNITNLNFSSEQAKLNKNDSREESKTNLLNYNVRSASKEISKIQSPSPFSYNISNENPQNDTKGFLEQQSIKNQISSTQVNKDNYTSTFNSQIYISTTTQPNPDTKVTNALVTPLFMENTSVLPTQNYTELRFDLTTQFPSATFLPILENNSSTQTKTLETNLGSSVESKTTMSTDKLNPNITTQTSIDTVVDTKSTNRTEIKKDILDADMKNKTNPDPTAINEQLENPTIITSINPTQMAPATTKIIEFLNNTTEDLSNKTEGHVTHKTI